MFYFASTFILYSTFQTIQIVQPNQLQSLVVLHVYNVEYKRLHMTESTEDPNQF